MLNDCGSYIKFLHGNPVFVPSPPILYGATREEERERERERERKQKKREFLATRNYCNRGAPSQRHAVAIPCLRAPVLDGGIWSTGVRDGSHILKREAQL